MRNPACVALALMVQSEIRLLDEPSGALEAMTEISIQEELARI